MGSTIYFVIPCYNEQEVLPETARRLSDKVSSLIQQGLLSADSRIMLVDDGSRDDTWSIITRLHQDDPLFSGLKLSRNCGHQNALLAGLMTARQNADAVISLDADLQDDIHAIDQFVERFHAGRHVVYGVRSHRDTDTPFKRNTARWYYKLLSSLGVNIVPDHADYRLMSRQALEALSQYGEVNLFLRGIVPLVGFPSDKVYYRREERFAGESKYPLKKMLSFAMDGITSFSVRPIRLITTLGVSIFITSVISLLWILTQKLLGHTISGWSTLMGSIWALGGIQLLCLGILGEYMGKLYQEVKRRPRYIIQEFLNTPHSPP